MASPESRIAGAITGLAGAILIAFVVVPEIKEWRMRSALEDYAEQVQVELDKASLQSGRISHDALEAKARADHLKATVESSRVLAPNERCMDGSVVRVGKRDGVPTYEQLSRRGLPVKCRGNKRL